MVFLNCGYGIRINKSRNSSWRKYLLVCLKKRLKDEGANELLTNCKQLKMKATDGKMRKTDVASTEQLLRIIQSIPSKKAEPFKQWLALVGKERLGESVISPLNAEEPNLLDENYDEN